MVNSNHKNTLDWASEDGVSHINIEYRAATELGRILDFSHPTGFIHPTYGHFHSMEGFWTWLRSEDRDDRYRHETGVVLRMSRHNRNTVYIENIKDVMIGAMYEKIVQNEGLLKLFKENTLPYDMYFVHKPPTATGPGVLTRHRMSSILLDVIQHVDALIKNDNFPLQSQYVALFPNMAK